MYVAQQLGVNLNTYNYANQANYASYV